MSWFSELRQSLLDRFLSFEVFLKHICKAFEKSSNLSCVSSFVILLWNYLTGSSLFYSMIVFVGRKTLKKFYSTALKWWHPTVIQTFSCCPSSMIGFFCAMAWSVTTSCNSIARLDVLLSMILWLFTLTFCSKET